MCISFRQSLVARLIGVRKLSHTLKIRKLNRKFTKSHTVLATSTSSVSPGDEELIRSELASMDSNGNDMQNG